MRIPWEMFMVDVSLLYIVLEDLLVYMLECFLYGTCHFLLYVAWSCYGADN